LIPILLCFEISDIGSRTKFKTLKKGFPLQAWRGSLGSSRSRFLDLLDFRHYEGDKVVTLNAPAAFTARSFLGTHF
jgi:hypothetical protein